MVSHTALSADHGDIHDRLARAARELGPIGAASQRVAGYFDRHVEAEERLVVPLLELLQPVAQGKLNERMAQAMPLFAEFEAHLKDMVAEHHMISAALEKLVEAAHAADRAEFAALAARLVAHMRLEEEVLYPAALLVGRYLNLRFGLGVAQQKRP
jgi:hemerythrin HHE cation binding domain-containing protein